jgi:hypothetical protein
MLFKHIIEDAGTGRTPSIKLTAGEPAHRLAASTRPARPNACEPSRTGRLIQLDLSQRRFMHAGSVIGRPGKQ